AVERDLRLQALAYVASGLPMPNHIGEIGRSMVEGGNFDSRVMRRGDEGIARAQTGPKNAQLRIALFLQPVEAAADLEDTLPRSIEGEADGGGNRVSRALNFA